MASAAPIEQMLEEATCSICLEYLTEPVTIDCGHNFCRACITQYSEHRESESGTMILCPQCREPLQKGKLRSNRQLADIVENIKKLGLKPENAQKENLCERHEEKLQLFCEEDGEAICVICRESRAHRTHAVVPIEEAAQDYKVKLQEALGPLRQELEEALERTSEEEEKTTEWQEKVENRRQLITCQFKKLHQFLSEEEQLLLQGLAEEERETLQKLQDNITKLSEQSATLQQLITEVEEKCQQSAAELLKDVKSTLIRSENVTLQEPEAVSPALKNVYKICLDMKEMLERFTVDVTLDPDTAHPSLILSEDQKTVTYEDKQQDLPDNLKRFDTYPIVLGFNKLTGGRHYWEVEVGDKTNWTLGVCTESVTRKGNIYLSPENGFWTVCLRYEEYKALTSHLTPLSMSVRPRRVGIFLDYDVGEVSFYNVTDKSHLFTFTDTFSGTLHPYFYTGYKEGFRNTSPLIICPVPAQAGGNLCA
ncbi:E3 ubiquitin-protein ligase TRIM39-like [Trachemys scripta elegans]|uniref:E3 ubiquitin-protein ligase TRIM39-like n=1 Tax=Trachemys scripta elegans TaxID=31138 RepID=UPI00155738B4|nr:E3 ubiquitin-protein ligase TRIM39-like [Trachemys scripta elegans]